MVFKCKMCGGDIEPIEGTNTGKCLYCKSIMTLPSSNDERILNLYNRANDLRLENEFDKAYATYESILNFDNDQIEAHWGLILCKYGVEYVDDPKTKKKVPTCHRTNFDSILNDHDYKIVKQKAKGEALKLYESEAKKINEIQKGILDVSSKEDPYDIFICYKETDDKGERTHDSVMAEDIYEALTKEGYKVFFSRITLEDKLGTEYEPYIFSALNSSRVMLVVGTSSENLEAVWVKNEWSRYIDFMKKDKNKVLIPVYSKMDAYKLPESFAMLQAQNMDKVGAMQDLVRGIKKIMTSESKNKNGAVTEDMFNQIKQMMEDEDSSVVGDEKRYSTQILKEKTNKSFVIISFLVSLLMACWMVGLAGIVVQTPIGQEKFLQMLPGDEALIIQLIVSFSTLIAFFLGFGSRKVHKASKFFYIFNLLLECLFAISIYKRSLVMGPYFFVVIALNCVLLLLRPRWQLSTDMLMLSKEDKVKQEKKNKKIKEKFVKLEKFVIHPVFYVLALILAIYACTYPFKKVEDFSNTVSDNQDYIEITKNKLYVYDDFRRFSSNKFYIYKGQKYNVLNVVDDIGDIGRSNITFTTSTSTYGSRISKTLYIEIKTDSGLRGYVEKYPDDDITNNDYNGFIYHEAKK